MGGRRCRRAETGTFERADGSIGELADVALNYQGSKSALTASGYQAQVYSRQFAEAISGFGHSSSAEARWVKYDLLEWRFLHCPQRERGEFVNLV